MQFRKNTASDGVPSSQLVFMFTNKTTKSKDKKKYSEPEI